jgi:hypothetical protein
MLITHATKVFPAQTRASLLLPLLLRLQVQFLLLLGYTPAEAQPLLQPTLLARKTHPSFAQRETHNRGRILAKLRPAPPLYHPLPRARPSLQETRARARATVLSMDRSRVSWVYLAVMAHAAGTHSRDARTGGTHMHELAMLRLAARVTLLLLLLHLLLLSPMPLL